MPNAPRPGLLWAERSWLEETDLQPLALRPDEVEEDWQRLRQRLGISGMAPSRVPKLGHKPVRIHVGLAVAAALTLALGVGLVGQARVHRVRLEPRINLDATQIWEDATRRGSAKPTLVADGAAYGLLILKLAPDPDGVDPLAMGSHTLEIWRSGDAASDFPVWRTRRIQIQPDLTATIELPRGFLEPGIYDLRLLGAVEAGARTKTVATFKIEIP